MPVRVIMNDKTALIGAARYAAMQSGKNAVAHSFHAFRRTSISPKPIASKEAQPGSGTV